MFDALNVQQAYGMGVNVAAVPVNDFTTTAPETYRTPIT